MCKQAITTAALLGIDPDAATVTFDSLADYAERRIAEIAADYGITQSEVADIWPVDSDRWYSERWQAVQQAARSGEVIDVDTLDALTKHNRRYLAHDYPDSIPYGYVLPEFR